MYIKKMIQSAVRGTLLLALISFSGLATASNIQEPGFTETVIGTIPAAPNGFGGMETDAAGNVYFAANFADEIYITPPQGVTTQFGSIAATTAQGVAIDGNTLYSSFSDAGQIYSQDLTQAAPAGVLISTPGGSPMGITVAPAGFGAFGGQLVVGSTTGIYIVNPGTGAVTQLWAAGTEISDVAFTLAGQLIAARSSTGELVQVDANGVATVFTSGLGSVDGLAVHPATGEIYVTDPASNTLWKVQPDGTSPTAFATNALVDGGYYPSPIAFSQDGQSLFYATRESGSTLYQISGFTTVGPIAPALPVPTLSNWLLAMMVMLLGLVAFRRLKTSR